MASCALDPTSMASIIEQKRALRSLIRRQLRRNYPSLSQNEDAVIQNHVLEASWYKDSRRVCAYISCPALREVDTSLIIADIMQRPNSDLPKNLYVPWIEDKESHMKLLRIESNQDLQPNSMNILEPTPIDESGLPREDVILADEPVDLILLPGLAFDRAGRRLGRGGGYYDDFLKNYLLHAEGRGWKPPLLIGLAYSLQVLNETIPTIAKDVSIDGLVSLSGVIPISSHFGLTDK